MRAGFIVLMLFLFSCSPVFSRGWMINVLTPEQEIQKNDRLEIGITPSQQILTEIQRYLGGEPHNRKGLNPFVSWDVNISADFIHQTSGEIIKGIAFWYTEVERDKINSHWKQKKTEHPFRIRFAPPKSGKWKVIIYSSIQGKERSIINETEFVVNESSKRGHVGIHETQKYLKRDGKVIIPTGVNLPSPYVNNNLTYSQDRDEKLKLNAWVEYRNMVQMYLANGGKHFRFFIHPSSTDMEFEEVGYYQDRQHFAWEVDQIVELCEENGALIDFNLMYHTMMMRAGDYYQFKYDFTDYWYDETVWPYKDINHISGYSKLLNSKDPSDMIFKEKAFKYLREKTRYMMARWGYSTAISLIELVSEPWHIDQDGFKHITPYDSMGTAGNIARKAAYKYHSDLASYIKDSLSMNYKLIGAVGRFPVGSSAIHSHMTPSTPKQIDSTWYDKNIDVISISYYSSSPAKAILSKRSSNNECGEGENSMACVIKRLHDTYGKPVIFGESDHGDGTPICSDLQGHQIDIKRYAFSGAAGHYIWAAFNYPHPSNKQPQDERRSWSGIIDASNYYNDDPLLSIFDDQYIQGRAKSPYKGSREALKEQQYLIDSTRTNAAGYIYNRTFNTHTSSGVKLDRESNCYIDNPAFNEPVNISWKPQKLKVEGLKRFKKYTIRYYGYNKREFLFEDEQRASILGKLKLRHPELTPTKTGNPVIWYTIEQK
tara:strand:- start:62099 stop:64237 length:2139 start_codon:yes stop_codon:yes gene_type:complete